MSPEKRRTPSPGVRNRSRTQSDVTVDASGFPMVVTTDLVSLTSIQDELDVYSHLDACIPRPSIAHLDQRVTHAKTMSSPNRTILRPDMSKSLSAASTPLSPPPPPPLASAAAAVFPSVRNEVSGPSHRRTTETRRPSTITTIQQSPHTIQAPPVATSVQLPSSPQTTAMSKQSSASYRDMIAARNSSSSQQAATRRNTMNMSPTESPNKLSLAGAPIVGRRNSSASAVAYENTLAIGVGVGVARRTSTVGSTPSSFTRKGSASDRYNGDLTDRNDGDIL